MSIFHPSQITDNYYEQIETDIKNAFVKVGKYCRTEAQSGGGFTLLNGKSAILCTLSIDKKYQNLQYSNVSRTMLINVIIKSIIDKFSIDNVNITEITDAVNLHLTDDFANNFKQKINTRSTGISTLGRKGNQWTPDGTYLNVLSQALGDVKNDGDLKQIMRDIFTTLNISSGGATSTVMPVVTPAVMPNIQLANLKNCAAFTTEPNATNCAAFTTQPDATNCAAFTTQPDATSCAAFIPTKQELCSTMPVPDENTCVDFADQICQNVPEVNVTNCSSLKNEICSDVSEANVTTCLPFRDTMCTKSVCDAHRDEICRDIPRPNLTTCQAYQNVMCPKPSIFSMAFSKDGYFMGMSFMSLMCVVFILCSVLILTTLFSKSTTKTNTSNSAEVGKIAEISKIAKVPKAPKISKGKDLWDK
jgi:hypothetical protein